MGNLLIIASKENWIDSKSVETLKQISKFKSVTKVVGLPDLSIGLVPNGVAILTKDRIYPHLIGGDIGCGMTLFEIPIKAKKIKVEKFIKLLEKISLEDIKINSKNLGYNLGSIGKDNHFIELHLINEIKDKIEFKKQNLNKSSLYTLIHSGSRAFGQIVFDKIAASYNSKEGLNLEDLKTKEYLKGHDLAITYAKTSRKQIAMKLLKAIKINSSLKKISDTAHNSITLTNDGCLHRKGATPTDQGLVIIAGSRGSLSYLVKASKNTNISLNSLAHGAGRKWERSSAKDKLKNTYSKTDLTRTKIGSRVLCNDSKLLYEEAPQAYKDIDVVIDDLVQADLINVIATFKPIITYKE